MRKNYTTHTGMIEMYKCLIKQVTIAEEEFVISRKFKVSMWLSIRRRNRT